MQIVDDFMKHIERRAMTLERPFDSLDGHLHAGTKAAWRSQYYFFNCHTFQNKSGGISRVCQPSASAADLVAF